MLGFRLLLLFFCAFLLSTTFISCEDDEENASEGEEPVEQGGDEEGDDGEVEMDNGVMVLTTKNFDRVVNDADTILVEFYAPWCGHCKSLAPKYETAAKILAALDPPIPLAKVDATVESDLGQRFGVSGYPTLKFFKNGTPQDYDGPRDEVGIVSYMRERGDPNWKPPPDAVLTLTKENFRDVVDKEELMLVEFYAPWCGHCKKLAPEYENAAKVLLQTDPPILLAKVDASEEKELGEEFDVSGYPALKVFRNGKPSEYGGGRDKSGIITYMENQRGDPSKEKKTLKDVRSFMEKTDVTVIAFFENEDDKIHRLYQESVNDLREDYSLGHTFDQAARQAYKVGVNSVVVFGAELFYSKHEPKWYTMEIQEDTKAIDIRSFIEMHSIPLVGHVSRVSKDKRYAGKRPLVLFFYTVNFDFDNRENTQLWRHKIVDIAKDFKGLTFGIADESDHADWFKDFGFEDSAEEMNVGILDALGKKYPMEAMDEFEADEISEFIQKFQKGKLKPIVKSQPIPKKQKGALKVVVGKNFEDIVLDKSKDVLIEFYAPWCGHCKQFEPTYKEFAKKFKKDKNLVIAKMDATANDAPAAYKTEGFPTIFYAPSNNKNNPIKYDGARSPEDLEEFIKKHATVSFRKKDEL